MSSDVWDAFFRGSKYEAKYRKHNPSPDAESWDRKALDDYLKSIPADSLWQKDKP